MNGFINYLNQENITKILFDYYKIGGKNQEERNFLDSIFGKFYLPKEKLNNRKSDNDINIKYDILGKLYEDTLDHEQKKKFGEFYTPTSVVNYILDAVGYTDQNKIETQKIIDISCGTGSFLIEAVRRLIRRYLIIFGRQKISELSIKEAKGIIESVKKNIFGIDINRVACILCQINIQLILYEIFTHIKSTDKNYRLPSFNIKNGNTLLLDNSEKYDYVIGNPPYLFIRNIPEHSKFLIESRDFKTNDGQYDYYQFFIELGIRILEDQGFLGYIVPDSLLALTSRLVLRKLIFETTKIKEIYYTGPKFNDPVVSNIIIILQKEKEKRSRLKNLIRIPFSQSPDKRLLQENLKKWDYKFLIHLNNKDISIVEYLNKNFKTLNDINKREGFEILLSRGVELGKSGEIVFCEKCKKYFPLPKKNLICRECRTDLIKGKKEKIIFDLPPKELTKDFRLYLYSINRYQKSPYRYINTSKTGINYKSLENYQDRIIIRQISQNNFICATYDKNLSLNSQSFYNLKIKESSIPEFNNLYLLGIINSTLLSYYFIKSFGSYKKLFPRILIEKIKNFPIKIPSSDIELKKANEIIKYVKISLKNKDKIIINQEKTDTLVFDLYQISADKRDYIKDSMRSLIN